MNFQSQRHAIIAFQMCVVVCPSKIVIFDNTQVMMLRNKVRQFNGYAKVMCMQADMERKLWCIIKLNYY